ncbi:MAG: hypothetical protein HFF72_13040 [Oscillospiraceae bacterium]|jgi:hypothetical protein|nr:hypothetical protein [Oscillospiraceae bacterium]MCI8721198.1 hypothetical protein [Oscillospiraceae bacterium]
MAKMNPKELLDKSVDAMLSTPNAVVNVLDQNGDDELGIDDIIILAVKTPGVHISRAAFLQKELFKNHPQDVIDKAIATTPAQAGISPKEIAKIADNVIALERNCVSGISVALGAPGGWAMAATIPADILQYYGYTLRATQKLLYLYGFPEIDVGEDGLQLDSETINAIIMCLGVMNGVAGANNAIKGMAKALAIGVEKKLLNMALTKGAFYPLVKSILKWFGIKLTKSVFAGFFKKAIPIVGGVIGGGLTFLAFKPCCYRLKDALQDTMLSNPHHVSTPEEDHIVESICSGEIIDVDIEEENAIHDESFPAL